MPEYLQHNYREPVTRGQVAEMFVDLLSQAAGKPALEILVDRDLTVNYGVFLDSSDINVLIANSLGIILGTTPTTFSPEGSLKRCQIAAVLNRTAAVQGVDTEGYTHPFTDVKDHWSDSELGWPNHAGIIKGVDPTTFNPERALTTEEAIAITYRAYLALTEG